MVRTIIFGLSDVFSIADLYCSRELFRTFTVMLLQFDLSISSHDTLNVMNGETERPSFGSSQINRLSNFISYYSSPSFYNFAYQRCYVVFKDIYGGQNLNNYLIRVFWQYNTSLQLVVDSRVHWRKWFGTQRHNCLRHSSIDSPIHEYSPGIMWK